VNPSYEEASYVDGVQSADDCKMICENSKGCKRATYVEGTWTEGWPMCWLDDLPFGRESSTSQCSDGGYMGEEGVLTATFECQTEALAVEATTARPTDAPGSMPAGAPLRAFCDAGDGVVDTNTADRACLLEANLTIISLGGSGGTADACANDGGRWIEVNCATVASMFWMRGQENPMAAAWKSQCCAPAALVRELFCDAGEAFVGTNSAGHTCMDADGNSLLDSNVGGTEAMCTSYGGYWFPYDCESAAGSWSPSMEFANELGAMWKHQCCGGGSPGGRGCVRIPKSVADAVNARPCSH